MEFKELFDMLKELGRRGFYGTFQVEFRNGKPYLGLKTEKVLLDRPMVVPLRETPFKYEQKAK